MKDLLYHDGKLVVDGAYSVHQMPYAVVVVIGDERFYFHSLANPDPTTLAKYIPKLTKENSEELPFYMYPAYGLYPRNGYNHIRVGRAATKAELESVRERYDLTEADVSEPFEDQRGAYYGEEAIKQFRSIQVRIPADKAIGLEVELRAMGIEAANVSVGRVNIRV